MTKCLVIYGCFGRGFGLGAIGESIIEPMEALGYDVYLNDDLNGCGPILSKHQWELYQKYMRVKDNVDMSSWAHIMCYGLDRFEAAKGENKYWWQFIESTHVPSVNVERINKNKNLITNSTWAKNIDADSGVTIPIHIIPPSIDATKFPYKDRDVKEPFTFLHIGDSNGRKNHHQLIQGYVQAFPDDGKTKLILKAQNYGGDDSMYKDDAYVKCYRHRKDIEFIFPTYIMSHEEILALYHRADCYINIAHGEGLGLPDMEAMATGLPVIGSNWDARSVFLDDSVGWMINISNMSDAYTYQGDGHDYGKWADYNHDNYISILRYASKHPQEAKYKGKMGAERIRTKFTPKATAGALDKIISETHGKTVKNLKEIEMHNLKWYIPSDDFSYVVLWGHEENMIQWVMNKFPHGKQLVDIGANVGLYSIRLARNFKEVVAVEPHPVNIYILKKNMEANNISNMRIIETAVTKNLEMMFFNQMVPNSLASFAKVDKTPDPDAVAPSFPVLGAPLDDYCLSPDFIKMDIEGGEFEAIYGMLDTIARCKPVMLIEVHQIHDGRSMGRFNDIMASIGYKCTDILHVGGAPTHEFFNCVYEWVGQ